MKKILFLTLIVFLFVSCSDDKSAKKKESYSLISLDSKKIIFDRREDILSTNYNKPYLLVFLSTWCDYCLGQAQHLANLNEEFSDNINIYGIFVDKDENIDELKKFVADSNTKFTWFYKGDIAHLVDFYHIKTFPFLLLYDKNGNLIMSYDGITPEEMIAFDIKKILQEVK
ncbi:TlpA disulfide reductase family protein [Helicobacter sp. 16-1353]|uniref:TlpA family protein disulfide reductase n=1 Tax=Helicobacter sp. 16-1353 TaxID=2004996 RepID=UPI0015EFBD1E|nr:TlpA disulfide reductase family protein [Helicobacter sp. 16-1353]